MALQAPSQSASYAQSAVYKLDLSEVLSAILLDDTDFVSMIGISNDVATQTKHSWVEDALNATTIVQTAGNSYLSGTTATVIVFSANISRITAGTLMKDQLSGKREVVQVTGVTGVSATVVRGFGGTSAAAHASGATWEIIANPRPQGMAGPKDISTTRSLVSNFTQIFSKGVRITGTADAIEHAGVSMEDDYQIDLRLRELKRELDRACIMGMKASGDVSSTVYGTMGGMVYWTSVANTGNLTKTAETLTPTVLNSLVKNCWNLGLYPDTVLVGGTQKQKISSFDAEFRRSTFDTRRAGYTVEEFVSDLGINLQVIVDRWVPNDVAIVFERGRIKILPLNGRSFFLEKLGKTGDSEDWQIVGEYTMEFRNANAAAYHDTLKQ
jgi:hypothetical protein